MPIYQYRCRNCDHEFEMILSIADGDKQTRKACPKCSRRKLMRLIAVPVIHLRGYSPAHPRFFRGMRGPRSKRKN
jgi:putative FmdB family regulatory protein